MVIFGPDCPNCRRTGFHPSRFICCGIALWNYLLDVLTKTADGRFADNASLFGKVYFSRGLYCPISIVWSPIWFRFAIQFSLFPSSFGFGIFFRGPALLLNRRYCCCPFVARFLMARGKWPQGCCSFRDDDVCIRDLDPNLFAVAFQLLMYATQSSIRFSGSFPIV